MAENISDNTPQGTSQHTAGAFDIRNLIGGLIGVYGIILTLLGLFNASDEELARGDGLNINLWAGLGMLVVGIGFITWARLRPVVVPSDPEQES
ncbi:hypothetical protein ASD11_03890 [Aeromicrobium sp. Root495]|uniref:hypothetical protein n=1 Tax=Aeromicrobium sp. Root495 TaxID=1736550 RepID=UPI000701E910|nr:hypothetical protein [Aeromicrobium sp. Root495]KQY58785.1 hypothetical protein ASD11_03890 [Aeromicrobium sp. Root495]